MLGIVREEFNSPVDSTPMLKYRTLMRGPQIYV
jgi:hypothetical protein